jgi:hypothetical protein
VVEVGRTKELIVRRDVSSPVIDTDAPKADVENLTNRPGPTAGDHVVSRIIPLEHPPHRFDVVADTAGVTLRAEVDHSDVVLESERDASHGIGVLSLDELKSSSWAHVVEEDPVGGVDAVGFLVVDGGFRNRR